jgi:hypothetical protein
MAPAAYAACGPAQNFRRRGAAPRLRNLRPLPRVQNRVNPFFENVSGVWELRSNVAIAVIRKIE